MNKKGYKTFEEIMVIISIIGVVLITIIPNIVAKYKSTSPKRDKQRIEKQLQQEEKYMKECQPKLWR
ncbi:hypothetical protein LCGC14_3110620 [marine sediment metagenome]|uniref:Uncharacterized protein n=1 Tax=marine sediment metagenome TaxID=412755 RepID=A0A0F8W5B3_9ZZZZ